MRTVLTAALALALVGCDGDPNPLAGTFEATSFIVIDPPVPIDVLALGGSLTITIASNNTTSGTLLIPGELVDGSDVSIDMAGTATRNGNTVTFEQNADSFVRDISWIFSGDALTGSLTSSGVTVNITMTRQP